jgi:hypothetical protein
VKSVVLSVFYARFEPRTSRIKDYSVTARGDSSVKEG